MKFKVDSYKVKQYENERFVDTIELLEDIDKKYFLCYSPKYRANVLVLKADCVPIDSKEDAVYYLVYVDTCLPYVKVFGETNEADGAVEFEHYEDAEAFAKKLGLEQDEYAIVKFNKELAI